MLFIRLFYRYFVFNFADYDLNRAIKRRVPFAEDHIKQMVYSLLRGLKVQIHSLTSLDFHLIQYSSFVLLSSLFTQLVFFIV
jgi:hypothetical protein